MPGRAQFPGGAHSLAILAGVWAPNAPDLKSIAEQADRRIREIERSGDGNRLNKIAAVVAEARADAIERVHHAG